MLPLYGIEACNFFCKVSKKADYSAFSPLFFRQLSRPYPLYIRYLICLIKLFFIDTDQHLFNENILVSTGYFQCIAQFFNHHLLSLT